LAEESNGKRQQYFREISSGFHLLNAKLMNYYKIGPSILENIVKQAKVIDLDEVTKANVLSFLPYVQQDMKLDKATMNPPLQVFTLEQIIGYIETSIDKGYKQIHTV
jgi:hypothetical protein